MLARLCLPALVLFTSHTPACRAMATANVERYRSDGVRITHDPYAPGVAEQYGLPGNTDAEGFDPYADTVGPGIYGGSVQRDAETGEIVIGRQYQNHNPRPGPVYDGRGYSLMSKAIQSGPEAVTAVLEDFPQLVGEISTGGATPLHTCGMSHRGQLCTQVLLDRGADPSALDTYGYTALHRMASNNLAIGAEALLRAGAENDAKAMSVARQSRAYKVIEVLSNMPAHGTAGAL